MIINQETMDRLYISLNAAFNAAFQATQTWYEQVAMTVPVSTRIVDYRFLLNFPMLREWLAEREIQSLAQEKYTLETRDWEATVEVDRNDIEDDQLGLYAPIVAALGQEAKKHPDRLVADALKAGTATTCYDGQPFFSDAHPVGAKTFANYRSGDATPWYLLDTSRSIKPVVFQLRKPVQFVRMDRPDDEHVFMRKKYRYGVDYRGAVGLLLWQLAYRCEVELNPANYAAARAAMMSLTNADGRPLGIVPDLLIVPPALEGAARKLLEADIVPAGTGEGSGSQSNIWRGSARLLVVPELA